MKKIFFIIPYFTLFSVFLQAQMIITDPALPVPGKLIKIFYDSSKDAGDLHNYTSDLYVHTGVTIKGGADWQKVIGSWGNNSTQPKMTYLGSFRYELDITPDIRSFYSLSAAEIAIKINMVIRNSSGSLQTRPDIFIEIFEAGLNVQFTLPSKSSIVAELNKQIMITVSASQADSISLFINNKFTKSAIATDRLNFTFLPVQYGDIMVKAIAWKNPAFAADSFFCYVRKPVVSEELPSGLKDGINITGINSAALVLHAPYKNFVFATGDFNSWQASEKGYMKRTPDGERYWLEINGLIPGKEYRFQYYVDTTLYIADPYSEKVLDPANDGFITNATYPGLLAYPKDTATGIVSVLRTASVPYAWKTTGYKHPEKSQLVIYELLVRDFTAAHDYKTLIDTLNYLDKLGINAIELMPVNEFEGNLSWGYNPSFYFATDKYYGPGDNLKALVDSCHKRGIAVILDMVLNHCFGQSPLVQLYIDHYGTDQIYMKTPNPWFNASSPNTLYKWGADFNHESTATQNLVDRITSFWLTEFKIDGFRFDFTKGFTNSEGDGGAYDPSRIAILKRMAGKIWSVNPSAFVILEHFTANSEEKELAEYGMMVWGNNNYNYAEAAMGYNSDLTAVCQLGRGWDVPNLVSYMESHDEERIMYKTITYGASSVNYNTRDLNVALQRMKLNTLFFLTVPGPKMIWQFGELGYDISIDYGGRTGEKPLKWDYFNDMGRHGLYLFYKLLIYFRKTQPVFSTSDYTYNLSGSVKQLLLTDGGMKANILGNFGITATKVDPGFPQSGKWYEYFSGDSVNVTNVNELLDFLPGEYRLYTTKKLPSSGLIIGIKDTQAPSKSLSVSAYPNPSSREFSFDISSPTSVSANVSISDFSGRLIRKIISSGNAAQDQLIKWDGRDSSGSEAPTGLYLVQVNAGSGSKTIKIIKQ